MTEIMISHLPVVPLDELDIDEWLDKLNPALRKLIDEHAEALLLEPDAVSRGMKLERLRAQLQDWIEEEPERWAVAESQGHEFDAACYRASAVVAVLVMAVARRLADERDQPTVH